MFKRLLLIVALGVTLSGCFMAPMALVGPAASGFSTASIIQSGVTSGASYIIKKNTGKSISEHAITIINAKEDIYQHSFAPSYENTVKIILPKARASK